MISEKSKINTEESDNRTKCAVLTSMTQRPRSHNSQECKGQEYNFQSQGQPQKPGC